VFVGEVKKGLKSGTGRFDYNNGNVYEGEWLDNLKHGEGTLTKKSGLNIIIYK
jgi:hypothetical protein